MSKLSAKEKLLNYLQNSEKGLTVKQARARFKIRNVSARINDLRNDGYAIYTDQKTAANGRRTSVYLYG